MQSFGTVFLDTVVLQIEFFHEPIQYQSMYFFRPFAIDMAGFAVNVKHFLSKTKAKFAYQVKRGHQESEFLKHLVTLDELEPQAEQCTKVLVWHTRTEKVDVKQEKRRKDSGLELSDHGIEV